jgi:hypothetical protein
MADNFVSYVKDEDDFTLRIGDVSFISYVREEENFTLTILGTISASWRINVTIPNSIRITSMKQNIKVNLPVKIPAIAMFIDETLIKLFHILHSNVKIPVISIGLTLRQRISSSLALKVPTITMNVKELLRKKANLNLHVPVITMTLTPEVKTFNRLCDTNYFTIQQTSGSTLAQMQYRII